MAFPAQQPDRRSPVRQQAQRRICLARRRGQAVADFQSAVSPNCIRQSVGSVPRAVVPRRLAECNSAIQPSAAKPQPKERGSVTSVTRSSFAGHPAFRQVQRIGRYRRAAAHRAALRKVVAACDDLDRYWYGGHREFRGSLPAGSGLLFIRAIRGVHG